MRADLGLRTLLAGALLALCGLAGAQQGTAELHGANGVIRLTGFSNFSVRTGGETIATAVGPTVKLEDTGNGMTLTGKTMSVTLRRNSDGATEVVSAEVAGGADAYIDTAAAAQARKRPSKENTKAHIVSEQFTYTTSGDEGKLVAPQKVTYDAVTTGNGTKKDKAGNILPTTYTQTMKLNGSSATFTLGVPAKQGEDPKPRTGRIEGPVLFDLLRNEVASDGTATSHVNGHADLFTADFVTQTDPFLTATGNVVANSDTGDFIGRVTGSQAVITLDRATMQPKLYEFTGEPATTTVRKTPGDAGKEDKRS